jgi:hypothetical protein
MMLIAVLLMAAVNTVAAAFALVDLWAWFIAPVWSLAPLTVWQMVGVKFFVDFLKIRVPDKQDAKRTHYERLLIQIGFLIGIILAWGMSWALHAVMP